MLAEAYGHLTEKEKVFEMRRAGSTTNPSAVELFQSISANRLVKAIQEAKDLLSKYGVLAKESQYTFIATGEPSFCRGFGVLSDVRTPISCSTPSSFPS